MRQFGVFALLLLGAGCAPTPDGGVRVERSLVGCGPTAALRIGVRDEYREYPPACALPTSDELARGCAVADALRDPAYRWPERDEAGIPMGGDPLPQYTVDQVDCTYTNRHHNSALCRFALVKPGTDAPVLVSANLRHTFHADHGPAHHIYSTFWSVDGGCEPDSQAHAAARLAPIGMRALTVALARSSP